MHPCIHVRADKRDGQVNCASNELSPVTEWVQLKWLPYLKKNWWQLNQHCQDKCLIPSCFSFAFAEIQMYHIYNVQRENWNLSHRITQTASPMSFWWFLYVVICNLICSYKYTEVIVGQVSKLGILVAGSHNSTNSTFTFISTTHL